MLGLLYYIELAIGYMGVELLSVNPICVLDRFVYRHDIIGEYGHSIFMFSSYSFNISRVNYCRTA